MAGRNDGVAAKRSCPEAVSGYAPLDEKDPLNVDKRELTLLKVLGEGSQGTVYMAYHKAYGIVAYKELSNIAEPIKNMSLASQPSTLTPAAVKATPRGTRPVATKGTSITVAETDNQRREFIYTRELHNHPNILKFHGYVYEKNTCIGMLLEYMEKGSVNQVVWDSRCEMDKPHPLPLDLTKGWFVQLARALYYCQEKHQVTHRDIKMENALVSNDGSLKLCDFGYTRPVSNNMTAKPRTVNCAAPETIQSTNYGFPADVYSYGMFIYSVLHKCHPFKKIEWDRANNAYAYVSVTTKYIKTRDGMVEGDREDPLLTLKGGKDITNQNTFRSFLEMYQNGTESAFRPEVRLEEVAMAFCGNPADHQQYILNKHHVELLIWLMKQCWWTQVERRPTMGEIVDLLDFHFEPPLKIDVRDGRLLLRNVRHFPVVFKIRESASYQLDVYTGFLRPRLYSDNERHDEVDLGFSWREENVHYFLVDYVHSEDGNVSFDDLPQSLEHTNPTPENPDTWIKEGKEYWRKGLVTCLLPTDNGASATAAATGPDHRVPARSTLSLGN